MENIIHEIKKLNYTSDEQLQRYLDENKKDIQFFEKYKKFVLDYIGLNYSVIKHEYDIHTKSNRWYICLADHDITIRFNCEFGQMSSVYYHYKSLPVSKIVYFCASYHQTNEVEHINCLYELIDKSEIKQMSLFQF